MSSNKKTTTGLNFRPFILQKGLFRDSPLYFRRSKEVIRCCNDTTMTWLTDGHAGGSELTKARREYINRRGTCNMNEVCLQSSNLSTDCTILHIFSQKLCMYRAWSWWNRKIPQKVTRRRDRPRPLPILSPSLSKQAAKALISSLAKLCSVTPKRCMGILGSKNLARQT